VLDGRNPTQSGQMRSAERAAAIRQSTGLSNNLVVEGQVSILPSYAMTLLTTLAESRRGLVADKTHDLHAI
jgi:hypothetical protein